MRLILSSILVLSSTVAFADSSPPAPSTATKATDQPGKTVDVRTMASDDCARARKANKTCVLDIGEEEVEGQVASGNGERFTGIEWGNANSLIRLRRDFITEILRSAEDID